MIVERFGSLNGRNHADQTTGVKNRLSYRQNPIANRTQNQRRPRQEPAFERQRGTC